MRVPPRLSLPRWQPVAALTGLAAVGFFIAFLLASPRLSPPTDLPVAGLRLEFPGPAEVIDHLRRLDRSHPEARVVVLSEYAFDGPVPDGSGSGAGKLERWLIAGGKEPVEGGGFYNTAYVVSTNGEVVFHQAKSVPIQFFHDGLPAPEQRVWNSPWGRLGICICYDLNYTRVVDELIRLGATALIVPTMDVESWGRHEHRLNARLAPIRAAEHRVPVLRVASSGFSNSSTARGASTRRPRCPARARFSPARSDSTPPPGPLCRGTGSSRTRWRPGPVAPSPSFFSGRNTAVDPRSARFRNPPLNRSHHELVSPHRTAIGLLWVARIAGLASLALLSSFLVGEGLPLSKLTAREALLFLCFPLGVMLGLAWGWRQPTVGGLIALGSLAVFYALHFVTTGRVPAGPVVCRFRLACPVVPDRRSPGGHRVSLR